MWIGNKFNTIVKRNTRKKTNQKIKKKDRENTQKRTQNALIKTFKHKEATEMSEMYKFSNHT